MSDESETSGDEALKESLSKQLDSLVQEQLVFTGPTASVVDSKQSRKRKRSSSSFVVETQNETRKPPVYVTKALFSIKQALKRLDKEKEVTNQRKEVNRLILGEETAQCHDNKSSKSKNTGSVDPTYVKSVVGIDKLDETSSQSSNDQHGVDGDISWDDDSGNEDFSSSDEEMDYDNNTSKQCLDAKNKFSDDSLLKFKKGSGKEREIDLEDLKKKLGINTTGQTNNFPLSKKRKKKLPRVTCDERPVQARHPPPQVVTFAETKQVDKSQGPSKSTTPADGPEKLPGVGFDLKKAKHEVYQLAMKGMNTVDKKQAKIAMLVRLGAKPPKNPHTSIKNFMDSKKKEHVPEEQPTGFNKYSTPALNAMNAMNKKKPKKKNQKGKFTGDGQIGTFKEGVQQLSKKDFDKVTHKKRR